VKSWKCCGRAWRARAADRDPERGHDVQKRGAILDDLGGDTLQGAAGSLAAARSCYPAGQLSSPGRPREMIIEIDAEQPPGDTGKCP
jgi:hypothetical protein